MNHIEFFEIARKVTSADALMKIAKEHNIALTAEQAVTYLEQLREKPEEPTADKSKDDCRD